MKPHRDPSEFFRPLREARQPETFWTGFWPSVRVGIRAPELGRHTLLTPMKALLLGSSAGVMVAAALLVLGFLVAPALKQAPAPSAHPTAALNASMPSREGMASPPVMEELGSPSARVYTFHVGEKADATEVILIVDEAIDL